MSEPIRALIADDHPIVRKGLKQTLAETGEITVVAEVADGRSALERLEALSPDIAIQDIRMPGLDGLAVLRAAREKGLTTKVIFLTIEREEELFEAAMRAGAYGYVLKDCAVSDVAGAVRAAAAGASYVSPALTAYLLRRALNPAAPSAVDSLSESERRVLRLVAEYKTTRDIADAFCVSTRTVESHRANIAEKLGLRGSHALIKFALEHKTKLSP